MITCNADEVAKSLKEAEIAIVRKLEGMVSGFAVTVATAASDSTPVADADAIENNALYRSYYITKEQLFGMEIAPGFHAGAWKYSESGDIIFDPTIYNPEQVSADARSDSKANYTLGETFYIGAKGPGYEDLDNGSSPKAPAGIVTPTIAQIEVTYKADLQRYFDNS